jgi:hypothetical protein
MKPIHFSLVMFALVSGCAPSFQAATPPGFVVLDEEYANYDYRATTADGLVLAAREIEHEPVGDVNFWVRAVENEMRMRGGYAHLETKTVKNRQGLEGRQLWFGHDEGSKPHLYMVTLFVTPKWIYLLEAGGTKEQVDKQRTQITWAVDNFQGG